MPTMNGLQLKSYKLGYTRTHADGKEDKNVRCI